MGSDQNSLFFTEGQQVITNHVVAHLNHQHINFSVANNKTVSATQQGTYNKSYVFLIFTVLYIQLAKEMV